MIQRVYYEDETGKVWEVNPFQLVKLHVVCLPKQAGGGVVLSCVDRKLAVDLIDSMIQEPTYATGNKMYEEAMGTPWDPMKIQVVSGVGPADVIQVLERKLVYDPKTDPAGNPTQS